MVPEPPKPLAPVCFDLNKLRKFSPLGATHLTPFGQHLLADVLVEVSGGRPCSTAPARMSQRKGRRDAELSGIVGCPGPNVLSDDDLRDMSPFRNAEKRGFF